MIPKILCLLKKPLSDENRGGASLQRPGGDSQLKASRPKEEPGSWFGLPQRSHPTCSSGPPRAPNAGRATQWASVCPAGK